jgi:hypothetical protein
MGPVSRNKKSVMREKGDCVRASVSFGSEDYAELERIAGEKRVSVAWVVREAVSRYLAEQSPLFRSKETAEERV